METLQIKIVKKSDFVFLVELYGPMDSYTVPQFEERMAPIMQPGTKAIILEMKGVKYMSSMGIGAIFKLRQFADTNRARFAMVNLQPPVQKVMETVDALPQEAVFKSLKELDEYLDQLQKKTKE